MSRMFNAKRYRRKSISTSKKGPKFSQMRGSYTGLDRDYVHGVIDMQTHMSTARFIRTASRIFWSLLKRGLKGTYVSVEPFHLCRYLDEQAFRYNNRKTNETGRLIDVMNGSKASA